MTTLPGPREVQERKLRPTVLLADNNPAILHHVSRMLAADFDVVAVVSQSEMVLEEAKRLKPDVIVLDISMPTMSGIDVAQHLRERGCVSKIVFLTVHEDADFVDAALAAGGSSYVIKYALGNDLIPALEAALAGKLFISPSISGGP